MLLDDSGSIKTLETYIRLAGNNTDSEASTHGSDTDSEASTLSNDTNSDASDHAELYHEGSNEPGDDGEGGTGPVWFVDNQEEEGLRSTSGDEESTELVDEDSTSEAHDEDVKMNDPVAKGLRLQKKQEFPTTPPAQLSAEMKAEWTFKHDRAREIRGIMKTNLKPNSKHIDRDAALAGWNSTAHPFSWELKAPKAGAYKSYGVLSSRESNDRKRLLELTEKARRKP